MRCGLVVPAFALALAGCISSAPGAEKVLVTTRPEDIAGCTLIGEVKLSRDDIGRSLSTQYVVPMQNGTLAIGGNVLFRTSLSTGIAYRCDIAGTP